MHGEARADRSATKKAAAKKKRKAIGQRVRFEIFKRDRFTCQYCGKTPPAVVLHLDHVLPVSLGGTNAAENLITSCEPCNLGKSNVPLDADPAAAEVADETSPVVAKIRRLRAEAEEARRQHEAFLELKREERERVQRWCWDVLQIIVDDPGLQSAPRQHLTQIERFIDQLGVDVVFEMADVARLMSLTPERSFRYFCGCCWKRVRGEAW